MKRAKGGAVKRRSAFTINPADAERLQAAIEQNGSLTDGEVAQVRIRRLMHTLPMPLCMTFAHTYPTFPLQD